MNEFITSLLICFPWNNYLNFLINVKYLFVKRLYQLSYI